MKIDDCIEHYIETGDFEYDTEFDGVYIIMLINGINSDDQIKFRIPGGGVYNRDDLLQLETWERY